jgi:hypothetical protein
VTKNSVNGFHKIEYFAVIVAYAGEKDLACEQIAYGQLKLSPFWDPLRGYPRFEKIVASLAPKEAK